MASMAAVHRAHALAIHFGVEHALSKRKSSSRSGRALLDWMPIPLQALESLYSQPRDQTTSETTVVLTD
jgi:hypothetical protein